MRPRSHPRRGANAVEFALLMPLYLLLAFGIVDFGWVMYHVAAAHSAAHHGCRRATLVDPGPGGGNVSEVLATAQEAMIEHFDTHGPGCPPAGCTAQAILHGSVPQRSVTCRLILPIRPVIGYVPAPEEIGATAVMRLEFQRGS